MWQIRPVCTESVSAPNLLWLIQVDKFPASSVCPLPDVEASRLPKRGGSKTKMVIAMNCLICVGVAERINCHGPWEERDCPDCGRYRVSDELLLTLMDQGQIFDVGKTRDWLQSRRKGGVTPSIEIHEALLLP
ncbi:hypothetical protein T3H00_26205 [Pseudomonas fluorescens]|uniref:hypothetical protein n=1 Tax=Pseudomonas fluorescens TaxID=294 RepID=UPI002AC9F3E3|nr:hypothetical protein [Pseudomonas fluorescens]MDZ5436145.1 hypothetical protein [Pseudomonas fluorescens]